MKERPEFVGELESQLRVGAVRVARRRRSGRRAAVAGVLALSASASVLVGVQVANDRDQGAETVSVGESRSPNQQSGTEQESQNEPALLDADELVVAPTWDWADTEIGGEASAGVFWTGEEVLAVRSVNAGNDLVVERWNPATNKATAAAASGLSWRASPTMAWTGEELLIVGGSSGPALNRIGAAYSPASDTWRALTDPPGGVDAWENSLTGRGVWTGSEMVVWRAGLAYDPITDSWRTITSSPVSERARPTTVWTGSQLIVWGGCNASGVQCDETNTGLLSDGAIYDVGTDEWRELPPSPLAPAVHTVAAWTGTEAVIVVTDPGGSSGEVAAAFDPASMTWRTVAEPPLSTRRHAAGVWAGDQFVVWGGAVGGGITYEPAAESGATYEPVTDEWTLLPDMPAPGRWLHSMVLAGDRVYVSATGASRPLQLRLPPVDPVDAASVRATALGDGTTVSRVTTQDGSVFALRLPESFGTEFEIVEGANAADLVELRGEGFGAHIQVGHCRYEPLTVNALGLLAAPVRLSKPFPSLAFCRPDEFLRLIIEPVPDVDFTIDQFLVVPITVGVSYQAWVEASGFDLGGGRGPMSHGDTLVVGNGNLDGQVTAVNAQTLVPIWTSDLIAALAEDGEWVGDGSYLYGVTDSGVVVATTGYGFVLGLSARSGEVVWTVDLEGESPLSSVMLRDGRLIVASDVVSEGDQSAPSLRLVDTLAGDVLWRSAGEPSTELQWTRPTLFDDIVLVADVASYREDPDGTETASLMAFDVSTGGRLWTSSLDSATEGFVTSETILADPSRDLLLAINVDGVLFRFDPATGSEVWRANVGLGEMIGVSDEAVTINVAGQDVDVSLETGETLG